MARVALMTTPVAGNLQGHRVGVGHLGLAYIAACLLRDRHQVAIVDCKNERIPDDEVGSRLREFRPDLVGVTAMTHEIHRAAELLAIARQVAPQAVTMVGGPHSSALPERTLQEFSAVDIAVSGEGEETACEIARIIESGDPSFGGVAGIAYRDHGVIVRNPGRCWIADLDALPFPAWRLFSPRLEWPLFAGRGCPFGCKFCQRALGRRVRMRSVDNVLAEIDAQESELGTRGSWFQDETFAINRNWTDEFLTKLEERNRRKGYVWRWKANSRANLADVELYRRMKAAGCRTLDFGIESGNPEMLKRIGKSITTEMAVRAIRAAKTAGLRTNTFFIIGHPGETLRTALDTVRFVGRLGADDIAVGVMTPYPGTEVWEMAKAGEYNYRLLTEDWRLYDKYFGDALEIKGLSHARLEALQVLTYVWYYLRQLQFRRLFRFVYTFRKEAARMCCRLCLPRAWYSRP